MKTVYCPIIDKPIDGTSCYEIVLVADRMATPSILPETVIWNEEKRQQCLDCPYHVDLCKG